MAKVKYVYWQDEEVILGYLQDYPDYMTQAESVEELEDNIRDIYQDLTSGDIPRVYAKFPSFRSLEKNRSDQRA